MKYVVEGGEGEGGAYVFHAFYAATSLNRVLRGIDPTGRSD